MTVNKTLLHGWQLERGAAESEGRRLARTNSGLSADGSVGEEMSPSQTMVPASPVEAEAVTLEGRGVGYIDLSRELADVADNGRARTGWKEQTVDDEELRLGN